MLLNIDLSSHFAKVVVVTAFWTHPFTSMFSKSKVERTAIYSSLLSEKMCRFFPTPLIFLDQKFQNCQSISEFLFYLFCEQDNDNLTYHQIFLNYKQNTVFFDLVCILIFSLTFCISQFLRDVFA